jgi:hypothetical protein
MHAPDVPISLDLARLQHQKYSELLRKLVANVVEVCFRFFVVMESWKMSRFHDLPLPASTFE